MRKCLLALAAALLLGSSARADAPRLQLEAPGELQPFAQATVTVTCPGEGVLTVLAEDAGGAARPVCEALRVKEGTVALSYDARSYAGMPLREGAARLTAVWLGKGGGTAISRVDCQVARPATVLEYALPQSESYYLRQKRAWWMDCSVTGAGTLNLEIYSDAEGTRLAASVRRKIERAGQYRVTWKGTRGKGRVAAGQYYCRAFLSGQEDAAVTFPLEVCAGEPPEAPLAVNGPLIPQGMSSGADDALVWAALLRPITVVDIDATAHQKLYAKPDPKSEVLGTVHGQSQGLEILEVGKSYARVRAYRHEDGAEVCGYVPLKKLKVVQPNARYGLLIDKCAQQMTVYEQGRAIATIAVSTGLPCEGKLFRETRAGMFFVVDRVSAFSSGGYRYEYPLRIDGGNLLHQVGFSLTAPRFGLAAHTAALGGKASEGCVRLDARTDAAHPVNAYWLWTHLPYGTPVLVTE